MVKVVHIHTDLKFISDTSRFKGYYFDNYIIIIAKPKDWNSLRSLYSDNLSLFDYSSKCIHKIVEFCSDAGLIVFYDLDNIKCKIALELPATLKKAWRFFGYEIYSREPYLYYSQLTLESMKSGLVQKLRTEFIESTIILKSMLKWGYTPTSLFHNAVRRIDYFLSFSKDEFDYLSERWKNLPCFVRLSVDESYLPEGQLDRVIERSVIIGNNRSSYNNNLDVINLIETAGNPFKYHFYLLNNYGTGSNYSSKLAETIKDKEHFTVINDFMPAGKFNDFYKNIAAAIFNGYRQMALGNVFMALKHGTKLYLNSHNTVMQWLRSNGIMISSVEDLPVDLRAGNLALTSEEAELNSINWSRLINSYTKDDFQKVIFSQVTGNRGQVG
jgi:dTDP-N-acetylfucosamine:lipid II N-acetylfucosaminyltransferase